MEPRFRVSFFNYPYYNLSFAGAKVVPFFWIPVTKSWQNDERRAFFDAYQAAWSDALMYVKGIWLVMPNMSVLSVWCGMPINTRVSRGWRVERTINPCKWLLYRSIRRFGEGWRGKDVLSFKNKLPYKNYVGICISLFFGIFLCLYHYFLYLCPPKRCF